ncbi:MAG: SdrD B-like domain-containing protein, partial [Planctomycetota bacterium]
KDGDGITVGDPIYDTQQGGRGKKGAQPFQLVRTVSTTGLSISAEAIVEDGGQELVLKLDNFRAGDRIEFTLDVDEVLRNSPDLAIFNDRLDVITSGQEFQDSILEATFDAPHYEQATADAIFLNDYGSPDQTYGLNLPPDHGSGVDSRPDRSAAAVAATNQVPKPVSISGHVWLDNDLDLNRDSGESGLPGVLLSLWRKDDQGTFVDTGHRATTDSNGQYRFDRSLGLRPGNYQVVETQPDDLFSVGSVAGTVDGLPMGKSGSVNVLTDIVIPLGDTDAVDYDFAEAAPARIGGFVYRDDNDNGRRESGEIGIGGVRVQLVPIDTLVNQDPRIAVTSGDGSYLFEDLSPGTYRLVELDQPAGLTDGTDSAGTVSGVVVGTAVNPGDEIRSIQLGGGDVGVEYNFGELPLGSISGSVYLAGPGEDCHRSDDGSAQPLAGVVVELQTATGVFVARTTTDSSGDYRFDDVPKGQYQVVETTPDGLIDGGAFPGSISGVNVGAA